MSSRDSDMVRVMWQETPNAALNPTDEESVMTRRQYGVFRDKALTDWVDGTFQLPDTGRIVKLSHIVDQRLGAVDV